MNKPFIVECPHCKLYIEILAINCGIFRHSIYKDSGVQVPPHTPKEECDRLFNQGLIYGCSKPFKIISYIDPPIICDYE
jgi:hypothetical protein